MGIRGPWPPRQSLSTLKSITGWKMHYELFAQPFAKELEARLLDLARVSEAPGELTRQFLTQEHRHAIDLVSSWMREAGLDVHLDAAANLVGRLQGKNAELPALVLGSHIETVRDGGLYDGALGIVLPILCLQELAAQGWRAARSVEVVAFGDEEGTRFQSTYLGSRAMSGTLDLALLDTADRDGKTMRQAFEAFGTDPGSLASAARAPADVAAYLEVHIEQGPVLEAEELPVGVVTSIAGATRMLISVDGEAGHAGTVPMDLRRDAMGGAAEVVVGIESICQGGALVGTVGQLTALPGAVNVIPGKVEFSVDVRAEADRVRQEAVEAIDALCTRVCARRGLGYAITTTHAAGSVNCDGDLSDALAEAVAVTGLSVRRLPSGAGHDAAAMAAICPVAMLFVRCKGGISHHPDEYMSPQDGAVAAAVVARFIQSYCGA